jgi:hypothetical protein
VGVGRGVAGMEGLEGVGEEELEVEEEGMVG